MEIKQEYKDKIKKYLSISMIVVLMIIFFVVIHNTLKAQPSRAEKLAKEYNEKATVSILNGKIYKEQKDFKVVQIIDGDSIKYYIFDKKYDLLYPRTIVYGDVKTATSSIAQKSGKLEF